MNMTTADLTRLAEGARSVGSDSLDPEDCAQDAALNLVRRRARLPEQPNQRSAYLYRAGRRAAIDASRAGRAAKRPLLTHGIEMEHISSSATPERELVASEEIERFCGAVAGLVDDSAAVLEMLVLGLTATEAAERHGKTEGNLYSIICRIKPKLAEAGFTLPRRIR